jgi:flagellar basal-body rod modification protein FlgD
MVAAISSLSSATSDASASGKTTAKEQTDRFMKLLVAQLNNQDPMNPMDNAQMTSQIAQINTVSGIQEVNDSIKSMATQFASLQMMQGASLVGREVLTTGNTLSMKNGVGQGSLELGAAADSVSVQVLSPGGQVLGNVNLGTQTAGRHSFQWDASSYTGTANPIFKVTATQAGKAVSATPLARNAIESVSTDSGALSIGFKNGATVAYDAIKAIL